MVKKRGGPSPKGKEGHIEFDRTGSFWSLNEDRALLRYYKQDGLTKPEIATKLGRTSGSIEARLKLLQRMQVDENSIDLDFVKYIREGVNPITGEKLAEDSAWRHPSIMEDISIFMGVSNSKQDFPKQRREENETALDVIEWKILANLCQYAGRLLPRESQSNIEIILSLYQPNSTCRETLKSLGDKWGTSVEKIRRDRNKVLEKMLNEVEQREILFVKKGSSMSRELINGLDFFKIEDCKTITPLNDDHTFVKEGTLFSREKLFKHRENNLHLERLLNSGFPVTLEEKNSILEMHNQGKTDIELERYFQRSRITIAETIKKYM